MPLSNFLEYTPSLGKEVFVAPGAQVIGRCELHDHASVWHNTVLRGDVNKIVIGKNSNVQDLSMLHVTEMSDLIIEENVTIGHSVNLHGSHIGKNSLIGIGSIILDDVEIGDWSIVAAGSLVTPRKKFPAYSMIMGSPAKVVREITEDEKKMLAHHYQNYLKYKEQFLSG